jgi:hypothetical protein
MSADEREDRGIEGQQGRQRTLVKLASKGCRLASLVRRIV